MNKTVEELAADILCVALSAKAIQPDGSIPKKKAESLGELYRIIMDGLRQPQAPAEK